MDLDLKDKLAIVTGGSRGIGKAVARELARAGADVALAARDREALQRSAEEIEQETGRRILQIPYDASADSSVRAMVDSAAAALGGVDILVNAAARPDLPPRPTLDQIDDAAFWDDVNVKVMGYLRCIREVVPHMSSRGGGRIVSVAGQSAYMTGSTIGSIRNISVVSMTISLAAELARHNIQLNVVSPGPTRTERTADLLASLAAAGQMPEGEAEAAIGLSSFLGRIIDASEVALVVAFLASPRSMAINGEAINVGGGAPGIVRY